jgi:hypothetical protein
LGSTGRRLHVSSRIALGSGVVALAATSITFFGSGVAAADDYAGKSYSDASSAISSAGQKAVIAGSVGDAVSQGDCMVTRSQKAAWLKGDNFSPVTNTVLLFLNCNAKLAGPGLPGNSLASPEGRAEKAAEDQKAAEAAQQQAAQQGGG